MGLIKLDSIPQLSGAFDHIAAAISSDATVDNHQINSFVVGVGFDILLHLEDPSTFGDLLNM